MWEGSVATQLADRSHHINDECSNSSCSWEKLELEKPGASQRALGTSHCGCIDRSCVFPWGEKKQKCWALPRAQIIFIKPLQIPLHSSLELPCEGTVLRLRSSSYRNLNLEFQLFLVFVCFWKGEREKMGTSWKKGIEWPLFFCSSPCETHYFTTKLIMIQPGNPWELRKSPQSCRAPGTHVHLSQAYADCWAANIYEANLDWGYRQHYCSQMEINAGMNHNWVQSRSQG